MIDIEIDTKYHTVHIKSPGDISEAHIDLALSPKQAEELLQCLLKKRGAIAQLVLNYYDCEECGMPHRNNVKQCPTLNDSQPINESLT